MTLTINLNENTILATITELEAKGCYEVAQAIEEAYNKECAKEVVDKVKEDFKKDWTVGYYFEHSNGDIDALYINYNTKKYHCKPIYISNHLMGKSVLLSSLLFYKNTVEDMGFEEV